MRSRGWREYVIRKGVEFQLESTSFSNGSRIPAKHTCDSINVSPPLQWSRQPEGTRSYALIMYDPDAPMGTFIHWVIYDIPGSANSLPEGVPKRLRVRDVGLQGINDFGSVGYGGPCPPPGHGVHRYFFALHALSGTVGVEGLTASSLLEKIRDMVIGYAILMGVYSR